MTEQLRFETSHYLVRPLTEADITDAWGNWLTDPARAHLLNAPCRVRSKDELEKYVTQFDGRNRQLFGIFHRPSSAHIGILAIVPSRDKRDVLLNILIGEDDFRSVAGILELRAIRTAVANYVFMVRNFRSMCASVAEHNHRMISFLTLSGWEIVGKSSRPSAEGRSVGLLLFRLTRESYIRAEGASWTLRNASAHGLNSAADWASARSLVAPVP